MTDWAGRLIGWVAGRRTRWITLGIWLGLAVLALTVLPTITAVEAQNPATLQASASSLIASRVESAAFPTSNATPGLLVFDRRSGLTSTDLRRIHETLQALTQKPLPLQAGSVPWAAPYLTQIGMGWLRLTTSC
jgi:RND superfamily putative drug exporter